MPPSLLGTASPQVLPVCQEEGYASHPRLPTHGSAQPQPATVTPPTHPLGDDALDEGGGCHVEGWVPHTNVGRNLLALEVRDLQKWTSRAHGTRSSRAPAPRMQWRCGPAPSMQAGMWHAEMSSAWMLPWHGTSSAPANQAPVNKLSPHLLCRPLLNRDEAAVVQLRVDGSGRRGHEEGHVVVVGGHGVAERANLVGCTGSKAPRGWGAQWFGHAATLCQAATLSTCHCTAGSAGLPRSCHSARNPPVSPFAAMRSAPTTTASTLPCAIRAAAAESQMRVEGRPSCTSS